MENNQKKNGIETNTLKLATEYANILVSKKDIKAKETIILNSLVTVYLDNCLSYINNNIDKKLSTNLRDYKTLLIETIEKDIDLDKEKYNLSYKAFTVFNKAIKNTSNKVIIILRLCDYDTVNKLSKLSNSNQKKIISIDGITKEKLDINVSELLKKQTKETNLNKAKKTLLANGYKVN
jgi:hypothetical protein